MSDSLWGYEILDFCMGCGTCIPICPTKAISGSPGKAHVIDTNLCIQCGACAKLCLNSCIADSSGNIVQRVSKNLWDIPHFNEEKCKKCGKCVQMCPAGVLEIQKQGDSVPSVSNLKLCASCRICAKVCIFGAVEFFPASSGSDILFDVHQTKPVEGEET